MISRMESKVMRRQGRRNDKSARRRFSKSGICRARMLENLSADIPEQSTAISAVKTARKRLPQHRRSATNNKVYPNDQPPTLPADARSKIYLFLKDESIARLKLADRQTQFFRVSLGQCKSSRTAPEISYLRQVQPHHPGREADARQHRHHKQHMAAKHGCSSGFTHSY